MKLLPVILFIINSAAIAAATPDSGVVHHPAPKKPVYVGEALYPSFKAALPPLPEKKSAQQKSDETELFAYQKARTSADCAQARTEVLVSLSNFFGTADSPIPKTDIDLLSPLFEQIRNDADYFIQKLKKDFPRQRPFLYLKGLEPCVAKEVTDAYPSGHAAISMLFGLVLVDLYPDQKVFIEKRAQQIADHRVLVGMHHRTDVEAGRALGGLIYEQLKKSTQFQNDLKAKKQSLLPKKKLAP